MRTIESLDDIEAGYYWLAIKGEKKPRVVAVIRGPLGCGLMFPGVMGNFDPPQKRYKLSGPLDIPAMPKFKPAPRARKAKEAR